MNNERIIKKEIENNPYVTDCILSLTNVIHDARADEREKTLNQLIKKLNNVYSQTDEIGDILKWAIELKSKSDFND